MDQRLERRCLRVMIAAADEHAVAAGLDREYGGRRNGIRVRNRFHFQVVGENDALVPELLAEQIRHHVSGQRSGTLLVECRHEHVRRHDRRDAGPDRGAERHQLDLPESFR